MTQTPAQYWNAYYEKYAFNYGKQPSSFLVDSLPRLQKGKVLDVAMGEGRNSVFLAKEGFQVKGFDISTVGIEHARKLAEEQGVTLTAEQADLDMYLMGLMEYDTVIMMNYRPAVPRYYSEMVRALKQGGTLLVESFMVEEMKEIIAKDEAYRHYYFGPNELLHNLKGLRILFYQEGLVHGRVVVQCLAQKPLDKDAAKYNLWDMHSKQKDSGPSSHMKAAEEFFKKK